MMKKLVGKDCGIFTNKKRDRNIKLTSTKLKSLKQPNATDIMATDFTTEPPPRHC